MPKAIVISASSDIGAEICKNWADRGWQVIGTYRNASPTTQELQERFSIDLFPCDLLHEQSIEKCSEQLIQKCGLWDIVVFAPGRLEPIGPFEEVDFKEWANGIQVNLLGQLHLLHALLPHRNRTNHPSVLFFAGGGANGAVLNYSCYTLSKIALTKMCELLDAEIPDTSFCIVGPGWVKTKIHESTLQAKEKAGSNYQKTLEKLESQEFTSMQSVIDCCNWLVTTPKAIIGGRNFSVVYDKWGSQELESALSQDPHMYKLRRHRN